MGNHYLLHSVADNQIVAIAVQDEATNKFRADSGVFNTLVRDYGAVTPLETNFRSSWILVAAKRGESYIQRVAESGKGTTNVHIKIPLFHSTSNPTNFPTTHPTAIPTANPTAYPTSSPTSILKLNKCGHTYCTYDGIHTRVMTSPSFGEKWHCEKFSGVKGNCR